jgi:hypothetical protein
VQEAYHACGRPVPRPARPRGHHPQLLQVTLLVVDEASKVADDLCRSVRPMLAVSNGRLVLTRTPFGRRVRGRQRVGRDAAHQLPRVALPHSPFVMTRALRHRVQLPRHLGLRDGREQRGAVAGRAVPHHQDGAPANPSPPAGTWACRPTPATGTPATTGGWPLNEEPLSWLKFGPGKETPGRPGWSGMPRPIVREENTQGNILLSPEMQGVFASILQVLAPFPEARAAVAQALAGAGRRTIPRVIEHKLKQQAP